MLKSGTEDVGHGHVTGYAIMELYGFSMALPVQMAQFCFCCQYTRNAYCWNLLVQCFQESESTCSTPGQLWCYRVLKLSSCRQGWITDVDSIDKQQNAALLASYRSVPTILHLATGYCSCVMSCAYCFFFDSV